MFSSDQAVEPALAPVDVTTLIAAVNNLHPDGSDTNLINQISLLEDLKSSCAAVHASLTQAFTAAQGAEAAERKSMTLAWTKTPLGLGPSAACGDGSMSFRVGNFPRRAA